VLVLLMGGFLMLAAKVNSDGVMNILSHDRVTIDGVWIGNLIYSTLTGRNHK
jgi:hypothetical protein